MAILWNDVVNLLTNHKIKMRPKKLNHLCVVYVKKNILRNIKKNYEVIKSNTQTTILKLDKIIKNHNRYFKIRTKNGNNAARPKHLYQPQKKRFLIRENL